MRQIEKCMYICIALCCDPKIHNYAYLCHSSVLDLNFSITVMFSDVNMWIFIPIEYVNNEIAI